MPSLSLQPAAAAIAACLLFTPAVLVAQSIDGPGERAQGMGGAFVAIADDATAVYWNPAGLSNVFKFDARVSTSGLPHPDGSDAPRVNFAGAALPALGLAYYGAHPAALDPADRHNEGAGGVRVSSLATSNFGATFVQSIAKTVVVGTTLRIVNGGGDTSFDLDAGATASIGDVRVGIAGRNLRQGLDIQRQGRVGIALAPRSLQTGIAGPFSIEADVDLNRIATPQGDVRQAALGSEQWWAGGLFATRLGIGWNTVDSSRPSISTGLSVRLPRSAFADGHVTKTRQTGELGWGAGLTYAF